MLLFCSQYCPRSQYGNRLFNMSNMTYLFWIPSSHMPLLCREAQMPCSVPTFHSLIWTVRLEYGGMDGSWDTESFCRLLPASSDFPQFGVELSVGRYKGKLAQLGPKWKCCWDVGHVFYTQQLWEPFPLLDGLWTDTTLCCPHLCLCKLHLDHSEPVYTSAGPLLCSASGHFHYGSKSCRTGGLYRIPSDRFCVAWPPDSIDHRSLWNLSFPFKKTNLQSCHCHCWAH